MLRWLNRDLGTCAEMRDTVGSGPERRGWGRVERYPPRTGEGHLEN